MIAALSFNMDRPALLQIKETCIYVEDLQRSREFYEELIGLECFSFAEESHAFFRVGRSVLLCFDPIASKEQHRLPRHFANGELHFAFEVERAVYERWKKWISSRSIEIEHEEEWPGGFRSFYFRDPDRNCVEIIEEGTWEFDPEK